MIEGWEDTLGASEGSGSTLGMALGWDDGCKDGSLDKLGPTDGCDVGQSLEEGLSEGCPLGMPDKEGVLDGWELGWDDGIDVGKSDTDGFTTLHQPVQPHIISSGVPPLLHWQS